MKKSLLIRWAVILVITIAWCYSMFPMRDKSFLTEFRDAAQAQVAVLKDKAAKAEALQKQLDAATDKTSKEYADAARELARLNTECAGLSPAAALEGWDELNRRIDAMMSGEEKYSEYKAVESAAKGNGAELHGIRLANYIKVPNQGGVPSNKVCQRYIRLRTAGKLHLGLDLQGGTEFIVGFDPEQVPEEQTTEMVRDQILEILRNRLDKSGVTEPEVKSITADTISIRMPSVDEGDKTSIRATIKEAAKLQFFLVATNNNELVQQYNSNQNFVNPVGVIRKEIIQEVNGMEEIEVIFLEQTPASVRGEDVTAAFATTDEYGRWSISMSFNGRGAADFAKVTGENVGRRLAIMLDDTVYSAPSINSAITAGNAQITGSFTLEEAKRLAGVISSGNLPVSIDIESEFGTEPKLGVDSIRSGIRAGLLGLAIVFIFMLCYYRFCGLVANIALIVNSILVLGTMALTGATITMPGIAGMVLTIGMAVDANVLIFERIREEQQRGKDLLYSISNGYSRAFSAIFDSNLTTLFTCFFLYKFGSGMVQGFAVTLAFGIIASMFTALFMSHAIFDLLTHNGWLKSISMGEFKIFKGSKFNFCKVMPKALIVAGVLVLLGLVGFFCKSGSVMGIDFSGGTQFSYTCDGEDPDVAQVREYLKKQGYDNANVGYKRGQSGNVELEIVVPAVKGDATAFHQALDKSFPQCKLDISSTYQVGPSVGAQFRNDSLRAALLSFIAIILYLAFRFELMYGVGAVVALCHDVIVAGGFFVAILGGQLSLTVIAAFMTIIGYSINNTIVIFDRIRETQAIRKDLTYSDMVNLAINSTLSRTCLTTLTTLFVVICLLVFGGGVIFDFAIVMLLGLIFGTFSSFFVAPAIVNHWHKHSVQDANTDKAAKELAKNANA
ncbi:MAG: protein translocase subunit SecD [Victivallales bacterium]|nr:protein translocase subunit SecD [Victivallales bacterium]